MLPFIAGAVVIGVGAYLMNEASSSHSRAVRDYDDAYDEAEEWIEHQAYHAQRKNTLDNLFKMKRAKQAIANTIYEELKQERNHLKKIDNNLYAMNRNLSLLFTQKKESLERNEKRKFQEEINLVIASRKELFSLKDELRRNINELSARLRVANRETRSIQEQINGVLED
jgi:hypothetical protein